MRTYASGTVPVSGNEHASKNRTVRYRRVATMLTTCAEQEVCPVTFMLVIRPAKASQADHENHIPEGAESTGPPHGL